MLLPYTLVSLGLDFTQMVLDVRKNLKPTQFYMLNNLSFNNFSKKSIPGDVRDQVLQGPLGASHTDQGRKSINALQLVRQTWQSSRIFRIAGQRTEPRLQERALKWSGGEFGSASPAGHRPGRGHGCLDGA